jgi:hypothetical protein
MERTPPSPRFAASRLPRRKAAGGMLAAGLALLTLGHDPAAAQASDALTFPMTADNARYWRFLSDRVMGGVSDGRLEFVTIDGRPAARMTGDVSTANNGGFIQFRAGVDFSRIVTTGINLTGIRIRARGNDQTYYIHLRTRDTRRPWHYYSAAFTVNGTWQQHTLPFSGFTHSAGHTPPTPAVDQLTSIGIVAYGRDHAADIAVSDISFY